MVPGQYVGSGLIKDSDEYKNKIFLKTFTRWYPLNNATMTKFYFQLGYIHNEDIYCANDTSSRNELNNAITGGLGYKFVVWNNWSAALYFDLGPDLAQTGTMLPIFADADVNMEYRF